MIDINEQNNVSLRQGYEVISSTQRTPQLGPWLTLVSFL